MNMKFNHLGMACFNIEKSAQFYLSLGYIKTETVYDPIQNVHICFLRKEGETCIELISPNDEKSPVNKNLQKNGVSPYHVCYETDDLEASVIELKKQKFLIVSKPAPAVAFENQRVCFLFNKDVGLLELVERGKA